MKQNNDGKNDEDTEAMFMEEDALFRAGLIPDAVCVARRRKPRALSRVSVPPGGRPAARAALHNAGNSVPVAAVVQTAPAMHAVPAVPATARLDDRSVTGCGHEGNVLTDTAATVHAVPAASAVPATSAARLEDRSVTGRGRNGDVLSNTAPVPGVSAVAGSGDDAWLATAGSGAAALGSVRESPSGSDALVTGLTLESVASGVPPMVRHASFKDIWNAETSMRPRHVDEASAHSSRSRHSSAASRCSRSAPLPETADVADTSLGLI